MEIFQKQFDNWIVAFLTAMKEKKVPFLFHKENEVKAITRIVLNFSSSFECEKPLFMDPFSSPDRR